MAISFLHPWLKKQTTRCGAGRARSLRRVTRLNANRGALCIRVSGLFCSLSLAENKSSLSPSASAKLGKKKKKQAAEGLRCHCVPLSQEKAHTKRKQKNKSSRRVAGGAFVGSSSTLFLCEGGDSKARASLAIFYVRDKKRWTR